MKIRNNVSGKVIQVADKGLNCARNIYAAVIEANDGYIFSKSIRGKSISTDEKKWIFDLHDELNQWVEVKDNNGNLVYSYKTSKHIDINGTIQEWASYDYSCKLDDEDKTKTKFRVKEKRVVIYNPKLAKKQRLEINKQVEKLQSYISYKSIIREELGDSAKYVNLKAKNEDGENVKIATSLNYEKIEEDLRNCGYNMIVTSELDITAEKIYKIYHNLWRIEESFRLMKSYLNARPVFLQKKASIYGHFLICYISLTLIRLIELKIFKDEIAPTKIIEFIQNYNVTEYAPDFYINTSTASPTLECIKNVLGILTLDHLKLNHKQIKNILNTSYDI